MHFFIYMAGYDISGRVSQADLLLAVQAVHGPQVEGHDALEVGLLLLEPALLLALPPHLGRHARRQACAGSMALGQNRQSTVQYELQPVPNDIWVLSLSSLQRSPLLFPL